MARREDNADAARVVIDQRPPQLPKPTFDMEALMASPAMSFSLYERRPRRRSWIERLMWWRAPRQVGEVTVDGEGIQMESALAGRRRVLWQEPFKVHASARLLTAGLCEVALRIQPLSKSPRAATRDRSASVEFRVLLSQSEVSRQVDIKDADSPFLERSALVAIWPFVGAFAELKGQRCGALIAPGQVEARSQDVPDDEVTPATRPVRPRIQASNRSVNALPGAVPAFGDIKIGVSTVEDVLEAFGDDGFLHCYHCDGLGGDQYPWGDVGDHRFWSLAYDYDVRKRYEPDRAVNARRPSQVKFDDDGRVRQMDFGVYQNEVVLEGRRLGCGASWHEVEAVYGSTHVHKPGGDVLDTRIYPEIGLRFYVSDEGRVNSFALLTPAVEEDD